ncbi:MAG: asparagine synthase (glutamine-hydrolyzing) [Candidatus Cloacimonetes bacterium]|jgi:asparagine synthase (glutamine-hydrolysing)|nr:asparagine synthase (glutamine-hydrolyzing) [Candidatus Cloacimonadota bacterium]MDD4100795.1 asparagine synthase (glutamine-hydrolyzing) [Candidatus Cloacimonadota bacterium]HPI25665.1 asparagine synthase (glutamine-hydrolyzing) [Candidatus Cloacimonadota bacterium]
MCGISGIYCYQADRSVDFALLKGMTDRIVHRGPDDEGYLLADVTSGKIYSYCGEDSPGELKGHMCLHQREDVAQLGFGFRRLPTLELHESGHQPMYDRELGLAIIFNGEIFNHHELREELQTKGYRFFSHSDTEVIIKAYHAWGEDALKRLNGMWAFAIWNIKARKLFCSRDRYGIKPFYYAIQEGVLYWGSEMKQLLLCPIPKTLNKAMIHRSLKINALMVYDDETYWQSVHCLLPGHKLIVQNGKIEISEYYHLDIENFEKNPISFDDAVQQYRELFLDSLKLQTRSDVEVAASLSGGMDSSAIVCSAKALLDYPMQTFSTYYDDDPALDERKWIARIAQHTGVNTHYIAPTAKNAIDWWDHATYLNDLPLASGFVSQYALMKSTHEQGIRVLLSGQGSDEISGGYRHATYRYYADLLRGLQFSRFYREIPAFMDKSISRSLGNIAKIGLSTFAPESRLYNLEFKAYRFEPFSDDFIDQANAQSGDGILSHIHDIEGSRLTNFLYNMMRNTSIQTLLHFEDRMSMGNSVEGRVPFLDHRLVDFVFSLPSEYKIKPPYRKVIHREAMKSCVPEAVAQRKDKGIFSSPFYSKWMRGELKPFVQEIIHSPQFRNRGIWNVTKIHDKWQGYLAGKDHNAEMLFNVIALEVWARQFM